LARTPLSTRRLLGLDRSGPPPARTGRGQPLNPWTIPNAIGFARLALLPVFLVVALSSGDGRSDTAAAIFCVIAGTDYLDGMVARVTGQYSRLGVLLDPLVDRLLVTSGVVVAWTFDLLPRWALALLVAREVAMLVLSEIALARGRDVEVRMLGRWAVWPTMFGLFLAMASTTWIAAAILFVGLVMTYATTALYLLDAFRPPSKRGRRPSTSP